MEKVPWFRMLAKRNLLGITGFGKGTANTVPIRGQYKSMNVTVRLLLLVEKSNYITQLRHTGDYLLLFLFFFIFFFLFSGEISDCQWLYLSQPWKHSLKSSLSGRSYEHSGIYAQLVLCTVSTNLRNSVPLTSGLFINQNFTLLSLPLSSYLNKNRVKIASLLLIPTI